MIDVLDRQDRRYFFHKKLLKKALTIGASFVPGGSTALALGRSFTGGGSTPSPAFTARAPVALRSDLKVDTAGARAFRGASASAQRASIGIHRGHGHLHSYMPGWVAPRAAAPRPPSIPPVNPVRAAVVQSKPVEALKAAPPIRRRIPQIFPASAVPFTRELPPRMRTAPRSQAMPRHRKRDQVLNFFTGGGSDGCIVPGMRRDPNTGECAFFLGEQIGRDDAPIGQAIMGRFGAAYQPGSMIIDRAVCLPGDVVGSDGLCYPRRSIKNSDREWPRGRRPLLTGGDMRAISIAHRAGARMTRAAGRLQDMGIIKKPIVRKQIKKKH